MAALENFLGDLPRMRLVRWVAAQKHSRATKLKEREPIVPSRAVFRNVLLLTERLEEARGSG